jgi:hypothetical protein
MKNYSFKVKDTLITLLLYSVLFPFVFFPPLRSDLQPFAGVLAFLVMLRFTKMKFTQVQLYVGFLLALISAMSIVYILVGIFTENGLSPQLYQFSKIFSLFYGLIILYVFESKDINFRKSMLNNAVIIYATCTLLYLLLRNNYLILQSFIINSRGGEGWSSEGNSRGVSILSPEPSVFSSILIFLLRLNDHFFYDLKENTKKRFRLNFLLLFIMIIFNKSATGLFMFGVYTLFFFFKHVKYSLLYLAAGVGLIVMILLNIDFSSANNRSINLILTILTSKNVSILDILSADASIGGRFWDWLLGIYSLFTYPLGVGYPFFYDAISNMISQYQIKQFRNIPFGQGLISPLAYAFIVYGIFFLVLVLILLFKKKAFWFDKFYFFYQVSFSISFGFPLSWAILTLNKKNST